MTGFEVFMQQLLNLLSDGRSRTIEMLAGELNTTTDDIMRKIDFLERSKIIRRVPTSFSKDENLLTAGKAEANRCTSCPSCSSCSYKDKGGSKACTACMPKDGFKNMGVMWEVI